jgi:hypothetical protein
MSLGRRPRPSRDVVVDLVMFLSVLVAVIAWIGYGGS